MQYVKIVRRPGLGDVTSSITDAAVQSLTPAIKDIMVNDVLPMLMVGLVAGAIAAAFIGSWFATAPERRARRRAA